jgi:hypothetical protein
MDLEIDSTNNPFIAMFPDAVAFKVHHAIESGINSEEMIEAIDARKSVLEDSEIEVFLYPTPKTLKKAAELFQTIAELTALLAFANGGITMFGWHYQVIDRQLKTEKITGYAIQ